MVDGVERIWRAPEVKEAKGWRFNKKRCSRRSVCDLSRVTRIGLVLLNSSSVSRLQFPYQYPSIMCYFLSFSALRSSIIAFLFSLTIGSMLIHPFLSFCTGDGRHTPVTRILESFFQLLCSVDARLKLKPNTWTCRTPPTTLAINNSSASIVGATSRR
ncbi:hypothetical protein CPB84DRAFT_1142887 [Gymnopilus junonius]|uniref:Uncharacterized protein n=1 Tax=Gymnopilus junonius TaxID=109634 RepID=A0A9P5NMA9_GYMJU|nr:hypothetical protein CPB84DRAFT_1142887 [Gymnopilus junonius]